MSKSENKQNMNESSNWVEKKGAQLLGEISSQFGIRGVQPEKVLEILTSRGADFAELFFEDRQMNRLSYEGQKVGDVIQGRDRGCGLRAILKGKTFFGHTTDLSQSSLEKLAHEIVGGMEDLGGSQSGQKTGLNWRTSPFSEVVDQKQVKIDPLTISLDEKLKKLKEADRVARSAIPDLIQVTAVHMDSRRKIAVFNSDGYATFDSKTYTHFVTELVAKSEDRMETGFHSNGGFVGFEFYEEYPVATLVGEAVSQLKALLGAVPAPSGTLPVVISAEAGGTMIHEAVGHGLEADLACDGMSVYQNKIGQKVASSKITVIDDGTMPGRRGSYHYDDEGTPAKANTLIENGVLKSYMVDRLSAMKYDIPATGNGRRETFRHKPIVRMTNTYIAPGADDPKKILAETSYGLFVKKMGGGQVNTVTGDFVFAVTEGYLIRDGKLAEAVRGATLVGNGPQVLEQVDRVGTDLGFATGTCGKYGQGAPVTDAQPTLRIPAMTVGGEVPVSEYFGEFLV